MNPIYGIYCFGVCIGLFYKLNSACIFCEKHPSGRLDMIDMTTGEVIDTMDGGKWESGF